MRCDVALGAMGCGHFNVFLHRLFAHDHLLRLGCTYNYQPKVTTLDFVLARVIALKLTHVRGLIRCYKYEDSVCCNTSLLMLAQGSVSAISLMSRYTVFKNTPHLGFRPFSSFGLVHHITTLSLIAFSFIPLSPRHLVFQ